MKQYDPNDIFTAVKCQFNRKCANSQTIITRIADQFIYRYSNKNIPNPDDFKEDASITLNQLTLYSDQFVRVMKKFQFLESGALVVEGITSSLLKLNYFLSQQLYHQLNAIPSQIKHNFSGQLCINCVKIKESQMLKLLKEELHVKHISFSEYQKMSDMMNSYLQSDDVEINICNIEALQEDQIRNRLSKMQMDHDRRKREMMICLQGLDRANEKVAEYNKIVEKKESIFSNKFNVKDYIFKLSRHFCHNISSLELKIKQLKNSLNPTIESSSQTQKQYIELSFHFSKLSSIGAQLSQTKNLLSLSNSTLQIQQKKSKELQQRLQFVEGRLNEGQSNRQKQLIQNRINVETYRKKQRISEEIITQLKTKLREIKRFKDSIAKKQKNNEKKSILTRQFFNFVEDIIVDKDRTSRSTFKQSQFSENQVYSFISGQNQINQSKEEIKQQIIEKASRRITTLRHFIHQPILQTKVSEENIKISIHKPSEEIKKQYLTIEQTLKQCYIPEVIHKLPIRFSNRVEKVQKETQISTKEIQQQQHFLSPKVSKRKLSKLDVNRVDVSKLLAKKKDIHNRISEMCNRQQVLQKQSEKESYILKNINQLQKMNKNREKITLNTVYQLHPKKMKIRLFQANQIASIINKRKKKRNFSQQNSIQEDYIDIVNKCPPQEIKQKLLGQKQIKLLLQNDQKGFKMFRNSVNRIQGSRIVLSLQQINYSTYLCSLIANLHLKNFILYQNVRRFLINLFPNVGDQQISFKQSINKLLLMHRKCKNGMICYHLEMFVDKIKSL